MISAFHRVWFRFTNRPPLPFVLLVTLLFIVFGGVSQYIERIETGILAVMMLWGLILGLMVGGIPLRGWMAGMFCGSCAIWIPIFLIGRMDMPFAAGIQPVLSWIWHRMLWEATDPKTMPQLLGIVSSLFSVPISEAIRVQLWWQIVSQGGTSYDPLAITLVWSLLFFLVGAFAGWVMRVRNRILIACLPGIALLSATLYFYKGDPWYIFYVFAILLTVLVMETQLERRHQWEQSGMDYAERITFDVTTSVAPWFVLILLAAALIPQVNLVDLSRRIQDALEPPAAPSSPLNGSSGIGVGPFNGLDTNSPAPINKIFALGTSPKLSQTLMLEVTIADSQAGASGAAGGHAHYWRSEVYEIYNGQEWETSPNTTIKYAAQEPLYSAPPAGTALTQTVHIYQQSESEVYYSGTLYSIDRPATVVWYAANDPFLAFLSDHNYTAVSYEIHPTEAELRASGSNYPQWIRDRYLDLPAGMPRRIVSLAREWTASTITPYDQALAIQDHLRQYKYSLEIKPVPPGQDPVDYFLFDQKEGFCNYFASAMVMLARSSGIPARLVTGYSTGTFDSARGMYSVVEANAHAWPELYFAGIGWVEFEPTPTLPQIERTNPTNNPGDNSSATKILATGISFFHTILPGLTKAGIWIGIIISLLVMVAFVRFWGNRIRLRRAPPEKALPKIFRSIVRQAKGLGLEYQTGTTPDEFAEQLIRFCQKHDSMQDPREIRRIIGGYEMSMYGRTKVDQEEYETIYAAWITLDSSLHALRIKSLVRYPFASFPTK